jgi:hypothetical protein
VPIRCRIGDHGGVSDPQDTTPVIPPDDVPAPTAVQTQASAPGAGSAADAERARVAAELEQARELSAERRLRRARAPFGSMVLSLGVVLVIVVGLLLLVPRVSSVSQPPVDVTLGARAAAEQVSFVPAVPQGLPATWRATSVRTTTAIGDVLTWHAGFVTPSGQYAAFEQGAKVPVRWVLNQSGRGAAQGTQDVGAVTWQRYVNPTKTQNALVHARADGVTTVVTGTASFADLGVLAASLRPAG